MRRLPDRVICMLIGSTVCLAPLLQGDAPLLFNWMNNRSLRSSSGAFRPADEAAFNEWFIGLGRDPSRVYFAIRLIEYMRLLGYLQLTSIHPVNRAAELGILIGASDDHGKRYGREAVALAVEYSWAELNLQRVHLSVFANNPAAVASYRAVGFEIEGTLRRAAYVCGDFVDVHAMAILR